MSCGSSKDIFQEAINHCRWKKVLHNVLKNILITDYKNKNFEEIITEVYNVCGNVNGIGMLTMYDIASSICRKYNVNIDKVYIIGNGPKKAIKLLNIKTDIHKINDKIKLRFVYVNDVINAFDSNGVELDDTIRNCKNGDTLETYICNWQKTK